MSNFLVEIVLSILGVLVGFLYGSYRAYRFGYFVGGLETLKFLQDRSFKKEDKPLELFLSQIF